ncbi:MAG: hypothetical protein R2834_12185 [Rhodothermales bacterium]
MRFPTPRLLLLVLPLVAMTAPSAAQNVQPPPPCAAADDPYRAFDFWVGSWDVMLANGNKAGTNRIEKTENGCLLLENWTAARGTTGKSMNYVDPTDGRWRQVWVDQGGSVIYLAGGVEHGAMKLSGELIDAAGNRSLLRGTWIPLNAQLVRQLFEQSLDNGATWSTWFDGYYHRTE